MTLDALCSQHAVTVYATQESRDAAGATKKGSRWASAGTSMTCRIQPMSAREQSEHLQNGYEVTHKMFFAGNPSVKNDYKISHGSRDFIVVGTATNTDELGRLWVVLANESEAR